jgi:hypothetical protein
MKILTQSAFGLISPFCNIRARCSVPTIKLMNLIFILAGYANDRANDGRAIAKM